MSEAILRALKACRRGATALEFALVAPLFFSFVYGIIEVGLACYYQSVMLDNADRLANFMRAKQIANQDVTPENLRQQLCGSASGLSMVCDAEHLKIGIYDATRPTNGRFPVPAIIENTTMPPKAGTDGQYVVAVGYYWGLSFMTSKLLLPQGALGSQIQGFSFAVATERLGE